VPPGYTGSFTIWWSDSKVREEGEYLDGERHGEVRVYHPDGSLSEAGRFERGVPTGRHSAFHTGGVLALTETVVDGVIDGQREEYDERGRPVAVQQYRAGKRQGLQRNFHPDGSLAREGAWWDDLPVGLWRSFDERGRLQSGEWFWAANGQAVGYLETVYAPDGRITAQAFKSLDDGHWVGWRTFWHTNGVQAGLVDYRDELREGRDLSWSDAGLPLVEGQREGDRPVGAWLMYDDQGELIEVRDHGEALPDESAEG